MNTKIILILVLILIVGFIGFRILRNNSSQMGNVTQSHRSYEMEVTSENNQLVPNQTTTFTYKVKKDIGNTLNQFEIAHEKIMHFIAVRKDLQHFQHLHPEYNQQTNEFSINLSFPEEGEYRLFADFVPGTENFQKLPVVVFSDIKVGEIFQEVPVKLDQQNIKTADGYSVTYLFPDEKDLYEEEEVTYSLVIEKDGNPVKDLENYLGAKGHSVIIKEQTLDYIHTHALENSQSIGEGHSMGHQSMSETSNREGNSIDFATVFPESGVYRIFTQFQHQGKVITSEYSIAVN